jgi:hypothetical protein
VVLPDVMTTSLDCTADASFVTHPSGTFTAMITAIVVGHCRNAAWVTCDVTLVGATSVLGTNRDAGMTDCRVELTFDGLQRTPYVNLGQVGYTDSWPAYIYSDAAATLP